MNTRLPTTTLTAASASWRDYLELCKPRVVALIVFTAIVGMLMATPGLVTPTVLVAATLGIGLAAAAAAAINHVADHRIDALMDRTRHRPLPQGELNRAQALLFAVTIGVLAMVILVVFVNVLTAALTFASLIGYAVIYTLYLKRATPQNIVIGGAAGAAPPVLGWTAVTGSVDPHSLLLFLIIFAWTPPHFWSLAIYRRDEYARADVPMLPVTHGVDYTRLQILLYTLVLIACTLLPYATYMSGPIYLACVVPLDMVFLYYAVRMQIDADDRLALRTFAYSIVYLMGVFLALFLDHYYLPVRALLAQL
ncbi:MAG: protoheme IX farnesyltransferase [Gammaproteobacteria bacterium]|nr:protoheme IX farnesyltransferase [Gammaproteobacteria bacterium]